MGRIHSVFQKAVREGILRWITKPASRHTLRHPIGHNCWSEGKPIVLNRPATGPLTANVNGFEELFT
jgi:hypothetical protein